MRFNVLLFRVLPILAILFIQQQRGRSATIVSGNVSGIWSTNQSPYILSADCTVVSNQTLTIQPGVTVIIGPEVTFWIYGRITAVGTAENPILFQGTTASNFWKGIVMTYSGTTNKFDFCRIRDVDYNSALNFGVGGSNRVMTAEVLDCDFLNCRVAGIYGSATASTPSDNPVLALEIHNCVFDSMSSGCMFAAFYYYQPTPGNPSVNPHITGNLFKNISDRALFLYGGGPNGPGTNFSGTVFVNNTVANSKLGIDVDTFFNAVIKNNLFLGNSNAIYRRGGSSSLDTSYNCFFNNAVSFSGFPGIYGIPIQSNHNGDPCDAFYNIFLDPRVLDTNQFLLANNSRCIDAGDPAISDVCFNFSHGTAISDIGAYGGPDACAWINHGFAPVITAPLQDVASCAGGSAVFTVRADGSEPFTYWWYFNGTNQLAVETNAQLSLHDLHAGQAGLYSVTVSNTFGIAASGPAQLLVSDACVDIGLYAGLSITGMVGRTYTVECATNLSAVNWTTVATNTLSQPRWLFIDTNTPFDAKKFFRIRLQP